MSDARVSIVVIGFNEADRLRACLASAIAARDAGQASEVIYVDGGSTDDSRSIAHACNVDDALGSSVRRSAAANRNAGWRRAAGEFVQFLDADMELEPDWLTAGAERLTSDPECAAVCGEIRERSRSVWARAFQLDWQRTPGEVPYCGGAAMFRRSVLEKTGGFPEDVAYGEEPLLCWRIRNDLGQTIEYIAAPMVSHDLAFSGVGDYWRRCKRVGETRASIAARCWHTPDPLWRRETVRGMIWPLAYIAAAAVIAFAPIDLKVVAGVCVVLLPIRKAQQMMVMGQTLGVSIVYALHTYFAKIPTALGILGWWINRLRSDVDAY